MPETIIKTIPVLRIFDEAKAKEFYLDFLGFKIDWEHRFEQNAPVHADHERQSGPPSNRTLRRLLTGFYCLRLVDWD